MGIELKPSYFKQLLKNVANNPWYEESEQVGLFTDKEQEDEGDAE